MQTRHKVKDNIFSVLLYQPQKLKDLSLIPVEICKIQVSNYKKGLTAAIPKH